MPLLSSLLHKPNILSSFSPLLRYALPHYAMWAPEKPAEPKATPAPFRLLGPPGLRKPKQESVQEDPFLKLMDKNYNNTPTKTLTENNSPTFASSGNPCLDFFFHVVPDTPPESVRARLATAWNQDPLTALKLVCNLRGIRGTGKSDREGFYACALWLHEHHPKTLALNSSIFGEFGYHKDLLEILYRIINGPDFRAKQKYQWERIKNEWQRWNWQNNDGNSSREGLKKILMKQSIRAMKKEDLYLRALETYEDDEKYCFLHNQVSEHFANLLLSDLANLKKGKKFGRSLAAKWCPSLDSGFDKHTLICEMIARRVFPQESYPEYKGLEEAHYAYRVRDRLRKEVLVPLRKSIQMPEIYMSAGLWDKLPYKRVPSIAMKIYKKLFYNHDEERFKEYLDSVKKGKAKIASGALLPHQILEDAYNGVENEVAELQWKRTIDDLVKEGKLSNCIAVCDVSGSMYELPLQVCVSLGMLTSELSEEPWKGRLITFSQLPQIHKIEGDSLGKKFGSIKRMDWGYNTNFQAVFDRLLDVAVEGKLEPEKMIKRVFVFSDMEFDQASSNPWETDYEAICRKYNEKGYVDVIPEIVFWNLRDSYSTPVTSKQKGVALVSGFSKNLVKLFLKQDEKLIDPEAIMLAAFSHKAYDKLAIYD